MQLETPPDLRTQKRLKFLLRAYVVSWILAYLGIYRSQPIAAFLAESFMAGLHKMTAVWILSGLILIPILAIYFLYERAMS